jgi:argininosuccinate lyase
MTRKLWQSGSEKLDPVVERFLAADDIRWDQRLVPYDILGNAVQARVLVRAKVLTPAEGRRLVSALRALYRLWERGGLTLRLSDEDVHTRIEAELTKRLGALGKKIHTGRSRNDQVLVDLLLYQRERLTDLRIAVLELADACFRVARHHQWTPMPGYTHMQRAMPSTIGLWMGSWKESFWDDSLHINIQIEGRFPLGSASGYGSLVPVDRQYAGRLLDVHTIKWNTLHTQTSRGKDELAAMHAMAQLLRDCNRLATDGLLFSTTEFGFVKLPSSMTTGSSLMPNKRNADVWELIRAAYHLHLGDLTAMASVQANLPSGYNRDLQVTKGLLIRSMERALEVTEVTRRTVQAMEINEERCKQACDPSILATDQATLLALSGTPFRDAYLRVKTGGKTPSLTLEDAIRRKKADGAPGNLGLSKSIRDLREARSEKLALAQISRRLLNPSWRMGR